MDQDQPLDLKIRQVLQVHARLTSDAMTLDEHADLFGNGMSSHASVNVMLGLEAAFDIEFPDRLLTRNVFSSIASIRAALQDVLIACGT